LQLLSRAVLPLALCRYLADVLGLSPVLSVPERTPLAADEMEKLLDTIASKVPAMRLCLDILQTLLSTFMHKTTAQQEVAGALLSSKLDTSAILDQDGE
jgi:hypothetical protein